MIYVCWDNYWRWCTVTTNLCDVVLDPMDLSATVLFAMPLLWRKQLKQRYLIYLPRATPRRRHTTTILLIVAQNILRSAGSSSKRRNRFTLPKWIQFKHFFYVSQYMTIYSRTSHKQYHGNLLQQFWIDNRFRMQYNAIREYFKKPLSPILLHYPLLLVT